MLLRRSLTDLSSRPLSVLLTRPLAQSQQTAEWISAEGGEAHIHPCLIVELADPQALKTALSGLTRYSAVALTSVHAARALIPFWPMVGETPPLYVLGNKAAQELLQAEIQPSAVVEGEFANATELAERLLRLLRAKQTNLPVLFPQAAQGRDELPDLLRAASIPIERVTAYRTVAATKQSLAAAIELLKQRRIDLLPLGSPRTAQVLLAALGDEAPELLQPVCVGAIGQTTAHELRELGLTDVVVSEQPVFEDLVKALAEVVQRRK